MKQIEDTRPGALRIDLGHSRQTDGMSTHVLGASGVEDQNAFGYPACVKIEFEPLFKLGRAERLQLVEDLWDSLVLEDGAGTVAEWKIEELQRRKERFLKHPSSARSWDQVKYAARSGHD